MLKHLPFLGVKNLPQGLSFAMVWPHVGFTAEAITSPVQWGVSLSRKRATSTGWEADTGTPSSPATTTSALPNTGTWPWCPRLSLPWAPLSSMWMTPTPPQWVKKKTVHPARPQLHSLRCGPLPERANVCSFPFFITSCPATPPCWPRCYHDLPYIPLRHTVSLITITPRFFTVELEARPMVHKRRAIGDLTTTVTLNVQIKLVF